MRGACRFAIRAGMALVATLVAGGLMASSARAATFVIDQSSGKLTKLKEYPMGKNPNWVEILDLP